MLLLLLPTLPLLLLTSAIDPLLLAATATFTAGAVLARETRTGITKAQAQ